VRRPVKIAASVLSADFMRLGDEIERAQSGGADIIHVDVMDGRFVPNMTMGPMVVKAMTEVTKLPIDVHLMVEDHGWFVGELAGSGVDMISVHAEVPRNLRESLRGIRSAGAKAGVALNPGTSIDVINPLLGDVDYLLMMTVNPGFGGQQFLVDMLPKIEAARRKIDERGADIDLEVDGGINAETASIVVQAGASIIVAGAAIYESPDVSKAITRLRAAASIRDP